MSQINFVVILSILFVASISVAVNADTVYLKNGHQIDGMVTGRHEGFVLLRIGNVGSMKIAEDRIKKIDKNARTGYLDPSKGRKKLEKIPEVGKKSGDKKDSSGKGTTTKDAEKQGKSSEELTDKLDPEVQKSIESLADELKKQKARKRSRAERKLRNFGVLAVPTLLKIVQHPFDLTRVSVFRLLKHAEDFRSIDACKDGLSDPSPFVRKLAWETLRGISGKSYSYPWKSNKEKDRARSLKRWTDWISKEKEARAKAAEKSK